VSWDARKQELARGLVRRLYTTGVLRTWLRDRPQGWELMSGAWSPFYVNLRDAPADPQLFRFMVDGAAAVVREELPDATQLVGLAAAGVPIAAAAAYALAMPMGFTRKLPNVRSLEALEAEVGAYGGHSLVEGVFAPGDRVVLVDDVVTGFDSKEIALRQLELELERRGVDGVAVEAILVLVERGAEARARAAAAGVRLVSLAVLDEAQLGALEGIASPRELEVIGAYLRDPAPFQDAAARDELVAEATPA
jgi:orotate phosphoribosyltransferase